VTVLAQTATTSGDI